MIVHDRLLEMVDLYAVQALSVDEEIALERHLNGCPVCEAELATALSVTTTLIPDAEAPRHVWERIVVVLDGEAADAGGLAHGRAMRWTSLTAIAAVIALVLAGVLTLPDGREAVIAAAETARGQVGSLVTSFVVDESMVAEVILTADGQGFVLPTDDLAPLDASRTYQLWAITAEESVISAGVLGNAPGPSTFTWEGDVSGFVLTREVAGGVPASGGDVVSVVNGL